MRMDLRGAVKGQAIVLDEPIDLPDGERVELVVLWPEIVPTQLTPEELEMAIAEYETRCQDPMYRALHPLPPTGDVVSNDMVNRIRETAGF